MWVIKKEYVNRTEYVSEVNTDVSRSFKLSEEICLFETEEAAVRVLKASGYNGISGIKIEEYVNPEEGEEYVEDEIDEDFYNRINIGNYGDICADCGVRCDECECDCAY